MSETPPQPTPKKEVLAPAQESLRAEFADDPLPAELSYGEARLWIVARDPHCLFAYWEFRPSEHPDAIGANGCARFFLRLYRDNGQPESSTEIDCAAGNCFLRAGAADTGYHAELGFFSNNVWCFLARSGNTRTPPELPADDAPLTFATIPAAVSLGEMRDLLADSALPGESVASAAARIQADASKSGEWTADHERLLAHVLGEAAGPDTLASASSATLARRIQHKLDAAAKVAAPRAPIPAPQAGNVPSSPGAAK